MKVTSYSLASLLYEVACGGETSFRLLFDTLFPYYTSKALRILRCKPDAEAVALEFMETIWMSRRLLAHVQYPVAYLNQAFNRSLILFRRKEALRAVREQDAVRHLDKASSYPADSRIAAAVYQRSVRALPPRLQQIFVLCLEQGLSKDDAARELGISILTVRNGVYQASRMIRRTLLDLDDPAD